jgi:hypothetical protein
MIKCIVFAGTLDRPGSATPLTRTATSPAASALKTAPAATAMTVIVAG